MAQRLDFPPPSQILGYDLIAMTVSLLAEIIQQIT